MPLLTASGCSKVIRNLIGNATSSRRKTVASTSPVRQHPDGERWSNASGTVHCHQRHGPRIPAGEEETIFDKFITEFSHPLRVPAAPGLGSPYAKRLFCFIAVA